MDDKKLLLQLKAIFIQEAKERLNSISTSLIEIEQLNKNDDHFTVNIENIFRDVHSLKGAARSVNLSYLEAIFQKLESVLSKIKNNHDLLTVSMLEFILDIINKLDSIIMEEDIESHESIEEIINLNNEVDVFLNSLDVADKENFHKTVKETGKYNESDELMEKINEPHKTSEKSIKPVKEKKSSSGAKSENKVLPIKNANETVRISSNKLDSILLKSENLIRIKQMILENSTALNFLLSDLMTINSNFHKIQSDFLILKQQYNEQEDNNNINSGNSFKNVFSFWEILESQLKELEIGIKKLEKNTKIDVRNSEKIIDNFLLEIKEIAMLPFSNILDIFPRMVKNIARELKKDVNFCISGDDHQIDRRILQEIKDPLIHLIRNSVDHGIEVGAERIKSGKAETGKIEVRIIQEEGGKIKISILDDGKGIDEQQIKEKLRKENILTSEALDNILQDDLYDYLYFSGFSTKDIITDISGRGLGLAIVKEKIESLGGTVCIKSKSGKGTEINIILPVALATFKGVLVEAKSKPFIVPSINVEKIIRLQNPEIKKIENKNTITYLNVTYPLINLADILRLPDGLEQNFEEDNSLTAVILEKNNRFLALKVDTVIAEQEILVKSLGNQLQKVNNISGATILTSGVIAPILNVQDIFYSGRNIKYDSHFEKQKKIVSQKNIKNKASISKKQNLLVVEDSITSRILLKNILESAGYKVRTAVDGLAAITLLKTEIFDLVVSDVEMPRMDGFTLTGKIKTNEKLKDIPVILVTSRASDEDKERGIDIGANAYIIKSQFDQSNLLDTVKSLI